MISLQIRVALTDLLLVLFGHEILVCAAQKNLVQIVCVPVVVRARIQE